MMIPAMISPMMCGMRNRLNISGANRMIASTIKNISTGFEMGSVPMMLSMISVVKRVDE